MIKNILNLGDAALYCDFGKEVNQNVNLNVISYFKHLQELVKENSIEGITNLTPSYNKLIISFDLEIINSSKIVDFLKSIDFSKLNISKNNKNWTIPICYNLDLDLDKMSKTLKIEKEEIINIHLNTNFFIYMVGFVPGHPFMGDLSSKLFLNRLKTPRVKVPAGSVGIVEKFCNIYPYESPGGWNILGRTPIKLFDTKNEINPCLLSPGDTVKFRAISNDEFEKLQNE